MKWPKNVLMVEPTEFDVKYAINPHMLSGEGQLNSVNKKLAFQQWQALRSLFEDLNLTVKVLKNTPNQPDMVFTANQTFPFLRNNKTQIVLSQMHSEYRKGEIEAFKIWAHASGFETYELQTGFSFEGMGDALWNYETEEIFGGHGFRTSEKVYEQMGALTEKPVYRLQLVSEDFYHLDTCLAIANKDTAFAVKEGFSKESFELLKSKFKNLIEIPYREAKEGFAGNLCCINGTDIIIQKGNIKTCKQATDLGFKVHEVETSEYIKSGGSVFCMKQLYW